jgi:GT2 family glycosyltransferase
VKKSAAISLNFSFVYFITGKFYMSFRPARILEVELSQAIPSLSQVHKEKDYQRAIALVRLHSYLIGTLEIPLPISPTELAQKIWDALSLEINQHLKSDGLAPVTSLPLEGLGSPDAPACQAERIAAQKAPQPVSVIIATVDRVDTLRPTLESLLAMDYPDFEIIVVDNAPQRTSTKIFMDAEYANHPQVRYVSETRPGLAQAHNRGLIETKRPFIAITDDDVLVDRYWLAELMKNFALGEDVGCVSGMIFAMEMETAPQEWIEQYGGFSKGFARQRFDLKKNRLDSPLYPYTAGRFGSGANMAFRTAAIRKLGGFDPALGAGSKAKGGDDLQAFFSIVNAGYTLVYEPAALLYHLHQSELNSLKSRAFGYGMGLSAYLTSVMVDHPILFFDILWRLPMGLYYMFSNKSPKNSNKRSDYPEELTQLERQGLFQGALAYLRSRWHTRSWRKEHGLR